MMRILPFCLALLAAALPFPTLATVGEQDAAPQAAQNNASQAIESESVLALKALQLLDQRVHTAGYRLVSANAAYCKETVPNTGLLLHDIQQYGDSAAARFAHGFASDIAVNAVAPRSPAAEAGVQVGDGLIAVDGIAVEDVAIDAEKLDDEQPEYRRIATIGAMLAKAAADGSMMLSVIRGGVEQDIELKPVQTCPSQFQIRVSDDREAAADGKMVSISSTLAEYVLDEGELAAIAAHELAHNLLDHRERLDDQGVNRGFFGQFGKSAGRIKATEIEADRLSVWLMANAGYDPQSAVRFWTRYGQQYDKGIFSASTHYRWKKRVELFEEEMAKMAEMKPLDGKYAPPLLAGMAQ
ncbi:M48 family metallopeptidase [Parasphingorhabdus sp.]|uniref:M48 family metallopeptidase n=1 Tax=Parasphingorhabdus sp. TaxID=2709688 RepID=UPI002F92D48B